MVEKQQIVMGIEQAIKQVESQERRGKRRLLPIAILAVIALAAVLLYPLISDVLPPAADSCENGVQDRGEEGVDCGGSCFAQCLTADELASGVFTKPFSVADVAVGPYDRIYVVDRARNRLLIYDKGLHYLRNIGETAFVSGGKGNYQFDNPYAVAVSGDGKIFVSERFPERIKVYDSKAQFLEIIEPDASAYGHLIYMAAAPDGRLAVVEKNKKAVFIVSQGKEVQRLEKGLSSPAGVAFASDGRLFVVDSAEHKVRIFSRELNLIGSIGEGKGNTNSTFNFPAGVAIAPNGNVVVADRENDRVQVFSSNGTYLATVGAGELLKPERVAVDSQGRIVVADSGNNRLAIFNRDYSFAAEIEAISFAETAYPEFKPRCLAVAPDGKIFVSEQQNSRIVVLDKQFNFIKALGRGTGFGNYEFNNPRYLAVDSEGKLYVADKGNNRVQVFDRELRYVATIGGRKGDAVDELNSPEGIAIDSQGRLFVVDKGNNRVQVFDRDFNHIASITESGALNFRAITIIAVDDNDNIYIGKYSDFPEDAVFFVFNRDLQYVKTINLIGKFLETTGLDVDSQGRIVFTAGESYKVGLVDSGTGEVINSIGQHGSGNSEFAWPSDVAFLPDGKIVVADFGNQRLQLFDPELNFLRVIDGGSDGLIESSG